MHYFILRREDVGEFQKVVEKWVNEDGWELHGGPFVAQEGEFNGASYSNTRLFYCQCVTQGK
jgi:hypothetical protein